MERFTRMFQKGFFQSVLLFWFLSGACTSLMAEVVLVSPQGPSLSPETSEEFPESRFGFPPNSQTIMRSPAGLEFTEDTTEVRSGSVNPVASLSKSATNWNPKPYSSSQPGVQEVALIVSDLGFFPKTLFVTQGIPVKLFVTGTSKKTLCIMMDSFDIRKQIKSQKMEELNFTPTTLGQYRFYCPVNGMEGTVLVKELSSVLHRSTDTESQLHSSVRGH